jgi:hypothetical protein
MLVATSSANGHLKLFIRSNLGIRQHDAAPDRGHPGARAYRTRPSALDTKHGKEFAKVAKAIGLVGKMKSKVLGPAFEKMIAPLLEATGPLPHARLNTGAGRSTRPKKQTNRNVKCTFPECGYVVRVSRQSIESLSRCARWITSR